MPESLALNFEQQIKDKIKDEFMQLIPEDKWDELIAKTLKDFTEGRAPKDRWDKRKPSQFELIVKAALEEQTQATVSAKIAEYLEKNKAALPNLVETLVVKHGEQLMQSYFNNTLSIAVHGAIDNLTNSMQLGTPCPSCNKVNNFGSGGYGSCGGCGYGYQT